MTMQPAVIGIDLGTTYSLVAAVVDGKPVILRNALRETLTPSAVSVDDEGRIIVGAPARARATTHPEKTARSFKRDMGTDRRRTLGGRTFRPEELSALVLAELKRDAEDALGAPVSEAVITVPAYFGEAQRRSTRDAAALAGLHVERIINEPTAAALAYGLNERDREVRAVVLDLGGGTFDVTVLEILEGVVEVQGTAGDAQLGGDDFDSELAGFVAARVRAQGADLEASPAAWARLLDGCEGAKKRLSATAEARIFLPELPLSTGGTFTLDESIRRQDAEAVWAPLLARIRAPIESALRTAKTSAASIDEVLLVGGSSRMPCIALLAQELFGRAPNVSLPPDEAIAMGAALQASMKRGQSDVADLVATDIAGFTLGVSSAVQEGDELLRGIFSPIIDRGTVLPVSRVKRFFALHPAQTTLSVEVFQGEHSLCRNNQLLGKYVVKDLQPASWGVPVIDIRFTYDLNGLLEVETVDVATQKKSVLVIEGNRSRMSPEEIARAQAAMLALKIHPRETLPNRTALDRGDALYLELVGTERESLGTILGRFRAALESPDPQGIDRLRDELNSLVSRLGGR